MYAVPVQNKPQKRRYADSMIIYFLSSTYNVYVCILRAYQYAYLANMYIHIYFYTVFIYDGTFGLILAISICI